MILSVVPTLAIKFLFWALALAVFMRYLALAWRPTPALARQVGAALLLGAVLGSKLVFALNYPEVTIDALGGDARALLLLAGSGSAPGALLGAALALRWTRRPAEARFDLDLLVVPVAVALAILDLGASIWALSEPGFGVATGLPWGVDFGDGVVRHPVMLYEALFLVVAAWAHARLTDQVFQPGERALLFIAGYCGLRVLTDYMRPPFGPPLLAEMMHPHAWIFGYVMTAEQWICLLATVALIPAWLTVTRRLLGAVLRS